MRHSALDWGGFTHIQSAPAMTMAAISNGATYKNSLRRKDMIDFHFRKRRSIQHSLIL
ncbi:hypothetical protein D3C80_1919420 [compost metagenome]